MRKTLITAFFAVLTATTWAEAYNQYQNYNPAQSFVFAASSPHNPAVLGDSVHAPGTNIFDPHSATIYFISPIGTRRPYTSIGNFSSYGFNNFPGIKTATAGDLALPIGTFMPPANGSLINDNGTIYLITHEKKAAFTSATVFNALGYSFANVIAGDVSFVPAVAAISDSNSAHLANTLISDQGTIYYMECNGRFGIPSTDVFHSWGFHFKNAVPANTFDIALEITGTLQARNPGELNPNPVCIAQSPKINIISPNGGQQWQLGSTQTITWSDPTFSSAGNAYSIFLVNQNGGAYGAIATVAGTQNYNWTVGQVQSRPDALPGSNYFIQVIKQFIPSTGTPIFGQSNAPFSITPESTGNNSLNVSLSSNSPGAGNILKGQNTNMAIFQLCNTTSSNISLSSLTLSRIGLGNDSDIYNLALFSGATQISTNVVAALNNSKAVFSIAGVVLSPNVCTNISALATASANANIGDTIGLAIAQGSDINASSSNGSPIFITGTFPVNGNLMTISGSNLLVTSPAGSVPGFVTQASNANLVGSFRFAAQNSNISINSIKFTLLGTTPLTSFSNLKLVDTNNNQIGSTVAALSSDRSATFNFVSKPIVANGTIRTFNFYTDIASDSVSKASGTGFQVVIQRFSDMQAIDSSNAAAFINLGVLGGVGPVPAGSDNFVNITAAPPAGGVISMISPSGNEQWNQNSTQLVKWLAPASVNSVNISLSAYIACLNSLPRCLIPTPAPINIASNVPNTGSYTWNIPTSIAVGQYTLTIADSASSALPASNAIAFNIIAAASSTNTNTNPLPGPVLPPVPAPTPTPTTTPGLVGPPTPLVPPPPPTTTPPPTTPPAVLSVTNPVSSQNLTEGQTLSVQWNFSSTNAAGSLPTTIQLQNDLGGTSRTLVTTISSSALTSNGSNQITWTIPRGIGNAASHFNVLVKLNQSLSAANGNVNLSAESPDFSIMPFDPGGSTKPNPCTPLKHATDTGALCQ
jgi:hypothetical protein